MMKKMTSYNECGRTLTETLAMLAIMGILSVVGMMGYTSAMDKSKANTLIQEAQKRAVIVAGQIGFNNQTPSLAEFEPYNTTSAGTFGDVITTGLTGQFGIQVSNVNKSICQNILNTIGDKTPIRRLSYETTPTTPITTCKEDDDFLFVYNNNMNGNESDTKYATDDSSCKTVCGVFNPNTYLCEESDCTPPENGCETDNQCNQENECMVCDTQTHKCKNGCERVAYLKGNISSGDICWIDTGVYLTSSSDFEVKFNSIQTTGTTWIAGSAFWIGVHYKDGAEVGITNYSTNTYKQYAPYTNGTDAILKLKGTSVYKDGSLIGSIERKEATSSFSLFGYNGGDTPTMRFNGKIYYLKIYNNGKPVLDFVPVIAPNGKACMFNKVPDEEDKKLKLYCNSGSGTFKTNKD